jgi:hypothetical protein
MSFFNKHKLSFWNFAFGTFHKMGDCRPALVIYHVALALYHNIRKL